MPSMDDRVLENHHENPGSSYRGSGDVTFRMEIPTAAAEAQGPLSISSPPEVSRSVSSFEIDYPQPPPPDWTPIGQYSKPCADGNHSHPPNPSDSVISFDGTQPPNIQPDAFSSACCQKCDKVYTGPFANRNLRRHMVLKHASCDGKITYRCSVCPRIYRWKDAQLKHERKSHPQFQHTRSQNEHGISKESQEEGGKDESMNRLGQELTPLIQPTPNRPTSAMDILVAKLKEIDTSWQPIWSKDQPKSADSMSCSPYGKSHEVSDQISTTLKFSEANEKLDSHPNDGTSDAHLLGYCEEPRPDNWEAIRSLLPESWMWDVEYSGSCWTYVSTEPDEPIQLPLTIAGQPLVLPVEYRWPPMAGVVPPPDPRPSIPIDCKTELSSEIIRDILITFKGSIGFYMLINGLLQIIVPIDFDTVWASSHLPHKYGGLKICYIPQDREPTMFTSRAKASSSTAQDITQSSPPSERLKLTKEGNNPIAKPLRLNDFIEARPKSSFKKERFSGRIGLRVVKNSESYLLMSTHVITEAILSKSLVSSVLRRGHRFEKLDEDWNKHVAIWAGNEKIGEIAKTFDQKAGYYPDGFYHDVTLVKPADEASTSSILSPIPNLGWINKNVHGTFRHRSQHIRFLGDVSGLHSDRRAKTLKTNTYSEALIVGQGVRHCMSGKSFMIGSAYIPDISTFKV